MSWGLGIYETEAFFDLCDRYGIMVYQEIGGGNELVFPYSDDVQLFERLALELGGTRTIHRTYKWVGSDDHRWAFYWSYGSYEYNLMSTTPFLGEFPCETRPFVDELSLFNGWEK